MKLPTKLKFGLNLILLIKHRTTLFQNIYKISCNAINNWQVFTDRIVIIKLMEGEGQGQYILALISI